MRAKIIIFIYIKIKSDTNTLLFNKMECYKKKRGTESHSCSARDCICSAL